MILNKVNNIMIVGGNAAGPAAAAKAKRISPDSNVIMFEAGEFISTGTCELPYVLSNEIKDWKEIVFYNQDTFEKEKGVKVYLNHFVEKIDRKKKTITVLNKISNQRYEQPYDRLILATGSIAKFLPDLSKNLKNVFTLKNVRDYLSIKNYLEKNNVKKVLIIGAGYIGLEAAESFKTLGYEVTILEKENLPMPAADIEISHLVKEILHENKIEFLGDAVDVKFKSENDKFISLYYKGWQFEFDMALLAIGFVPNNFLAASSSLQIGKSGGLKVDQKLRTSDYNIFAAGDNIEVKNKITGKDDYIPLATIAHNYGHIAGENAAGGNAYAKPVIKNAAVKIFDNYLAYVGINSKEAHENKYNFTSVTATANNIIKVMPHSRKVFGKILFEKYSQRILGAFFLGDREVAGYADLISSFIQNNLKISELSNIQFNYTPPLSPFINLLSILGRKINKE